MDDPLDVSKNRGQADCDLPKKVQEIHWLQLGCTDYEELDGRCVESDLGIACTDLKHRLGSKNFIVEEACKLQVLPAWVYK